MGGEHVDLVALGLEFLREPYWMLHTDKNLVEAEYPETEQ